MRRIIVHFHTWDENTLARKYQALAERMAAALEDLMGWARTGDEDKGHEFHGNQWVNVATTPKPTTVKAKSAKAGIHELLSSGHPFSKEELMAVCGMTQDNKEKLFSDYMAMLKNPKYAGAAGALKIGKTKDGMYQVQMPDGVPAPAIVQEAAEVIKAASATVASAKVPEALSVASVAPLTFEPPETPMTKEAADKAYENANFTAFLMFAETVYKKQVTGAQPAKLVQAFKQAKANNMAQWAANVKGVKQKAKAVPDTFFEADALLVKEIDDGIIPGKAFATWKANTAKEKQGLPLMKTGQSVAQPVAAPVAAPALAALPPAPPVTKIAYEDVRPSSYAGINGDDISKPAGFGAGIANLKSVLMIHGEAGPQGNKKTVEHRLRARLEKSAAFQALKKMVGGDASGHGSLESRLISAWASSSGDGHPVSCALQLAVRDAFSMPKGSVETKALNALQKHAGDENAVTHSALSLLCNGKNVGAENAPAAHAALQEFVLAQHAETQEMLKEAGIKDVYLARGMKFSHDVDPKKGPGALRLQPASSFSANYATAKGFTGGHGTVFITKVPASQVLSTYVTGFGCTTEHEVVVLSHSDTTAYTVPASDAGGTAAALEKLRERMGVPAKVSTVKKVTPGIGGVSPPSVSHATVAVPAPELAALKKSVVNAKSKAYKAAKAALANPAKAAHAAKAAQEAQAAVHALLSVTLKKAKA